MIVRKILNNILANSDEQTIVLVLHSGIFRILSKGGIYVGKHIISFIYCEYTNITIVSQKC